MAHLEKILVSVLVVAVSACSTKSGPRSGPDEFTVLPTKPLTMPDDFETLPPPRPNTLSRVDKQPNKDAVAALGGNPKALDSSGVRSNERALINAAGRNGVDPNIRSILAKEDEKQRQSRPPRLLERAFGQSTTLRAYEPFELDAYAELRRLRKMGVRTPTAPPDQE